MSLILCPSCSAAVVGERCPHCGSAVPPPPRPVRAKSNAWMAVAMIGVLVVVFGGLAQAAFSTGTDPQPVGLYVVAIGCAVAALWLIGRSFASR